MKGAVAVLAFALVMGSVLAGCGGGDDGGDPLTKTAYLERVNDICRQSSRQRAIDVQLATEEVEAEEGLSAAARFERLLAAALPEYERMVRLIAEVPPPPQEEQEVDAILRGYENVIEEAKDGPVDVPVTLSRTVRAFGMGQCNE